MHLLISLDFFLAIFNSHVLNDLVKTHEDVKNWTEKSFGNISNESFE